MPHFLSPIHDFRRGVVAALLHPFADDGFGFAALVSRFPSGIDISGIDEIETRPQRNASSN